MECVNISSNDILQLGVLLLSYKEVLHDSGKKKLQHLKQILHTFIRKSNQSKIMVFYHLKKSCCLHGRMCLFSMMIYLPKVILIKKKRKGKKSHIVYLIQDTWKSNSIETQ